MQLSKYLDEDLIEPELKSTTKEEVLTELTNILTKKFPELNREEIITILKEREKLGSTGIGNEVAIPHGKLKKGEDVYLAFGRTTKGINFDSIDGKPVKIFLLLLAPESRPTIHLQALAKISRILKKQDVREKILNAKDAKEIFKIIEEEDSKL